MSKWKILYGAGDVAVYNGLKKIFHVFPEEAEIVVKILNDLEDELARCKEERLGAEELVSMAEWIEDTDWEPNCDKDDLTEEWKQAITAFRASQQTQEGKG